MGCTKRSTHFRTTKLMGKGLHKGHDISEMNHAQLGTTNLIKVFSASTGGVLAFVVSKLISVSFALARIFAAQRRCRRPYLKTSSVLRLTFAMFAIATTLAASRRRKSKTTIENNQRCQTHLCDIRLCKNVCRKLKVCRHDLVSRCLHMQMSDHMTSSGVHRRNFKIKIRKNLNKEKY